MEYIFRITFPEKKSFIPTTSSSSLRSSRFFHCSSKIIPASCYVTYVHSKFDLLNVVLLFIQSQLLFYIHGQGKVKLSLCFNWAPCHGGVLGEWIYSSIHSLTSALDGGEWSASRPGRFTSRERTPVTHCIGGWVGPRAVLDAVVKRKIPSPRRKSKPRTPIVQSVGQRYTDRAITATWRKLVMEDRKKRKYKGDLYWGNTIPVTLIRFGAREWT
jgi:hypothetical protein